MAGLNAAGLVSILGAIATLVLLEGLLSADNALVLAVMVRHLPPKLQIRALRYGIIGAFVFRLIAVVFSASLLDYWIFKVVGGCYLLYLAGSNLLKARKGDDGHDLGKKANTRGFWGTVIAVELADIAFSIDSIVAAVALAEGLPESLNTIRIWFFPIRLWVVYIGGVLGIVMMRLVAGFFIRLLDRFAGLEAGAYGLVAWIGVKLVGGGLHNAFHPEHAVRAGGWRDSIPHWLKSIQLDMSDMLFWGGMAAILTIGLLYKPRAKPEEVETVNRNDEPSSAR